MYYYNCMVREPTIIRGNVKYYNFSKAILNLTVFFLTYNAVSDQIVFVIVII